MPGPFRPGPRTGALVAKRYNLLTRNAIVELLEQCGISRKEGFQPYFHRVRDRPDIEVLRCPASGVILLARTDHINEGYYRDSSRADGLMIGGTLVGKTQLYQDARRRTAQFGDLIRGKRWLDVGAGTALMLEQFKATAVVKGVEPNRGHRESARQRGLELVPSVTDLPAGEMFDIITLFHVYEHVLDPVDLMRQLRRHLAPGGVLLVEVPHARDLLLETLDSEAFRQFTLWSEHLILHTRNSLEAFLRAGGFADVTIKGIQRYPLANHLYWLRHNKPNGQAIWPFLDNPTLAQAYEDTLAAADRTDTLVAYAR